MQAVRGELVAHPLAVHVGIATGRVIVGDSPHGGNRDDGLAVGETPNRAARLQGLAGADEIVIGASTRRLIGNTFELSDLGTHTLKGIVQPVQAWRVQAVLRGEGRFDATHSGLTLTALVGRNEEIAMLQRRWSWALAGEGRSMLLSGEPGIGKSRLTEVLREQSRANRHRPALSVLPFPHQLRPLSNHRANRVRRRLHPRRYARAKARQAGDGAGRRPEPAERIGTAACRIALAATDRYPPTGLSPGKQKERTLEVLAGQVEALFARSAGAHGPRGRPLDRSDERGVARRVGAAAARAPRAPHHHAPPSILASRARLPSRLDARTDRSATAPWSRTGRQGHTGQGAALRCVAADCGSQRRQSVVHRGTDQVGARIAAPPGRARSLHTG